MLNAKYQFVFNGEVYTTIESLSEVSGLSKSTISNHIIKNKMGKETAKSFEMVVKGITIKVILLNNKIR